MEKLMERIQLIPIDKLIPAEWNYKEPGTEEQIAKLAESLKHDQSAGVLPVREVLIDGQMYYEVMDGNHRLPAIHLLGWEAVPCENFGKITKAEAILIARRRNFLWFEDDALKYAEIFRDFVLPEFDLSELSKFMPETEKELNEIANLFQREGASRNNLSHGKQGRMLIISLPEETYTLWEQWVAIATEKGITSEAGAFKALLVQNLDNEAVSKVGE